MSSNSNSASDDKEGVTSSDKEINEMTAETEMVDIGGGEFSLVVLADKFSRCIKDPDLTVSDYIAGYKEVYKFLALLGSVFGWVGSDVYAKITTLEAYLAGDQKEHYQKIKTMIDYEVCISAKKPLIRMFNSLQVKNNLIKSKKKDDPSGSRTLLRLHRALEYIIEFTQCKC